MKTHNTQALFHLVGIIFLSSLLTACGNSTSEPHGDGHGHGHDEVMEAEVVKGTHGGRLLMSKDFTLELAIFETGVPPEFRAWASYKGKALKASDFELQINLTRLGGKLDKIKFKAAGDAMRGDLVIYEPHSFVVNINATHKGVTHHWQYDNFEGRTRIESAVAKALEIKTNIAGPVVLQPTINVFGQVTANKERERKVSARFAGVIKSVSVSIGDEVSKGQTLATVESNESLKLYSIKAPISGIITQRNVNVGEQTGEKVLFNITDTSTVWVNLSIFPNDRERVAVAAPVRFSLTNKTQVFEGTIDVINVMAQANQSITARMLVKNKDGQLIPGSYVKAKIKVGEHAVPLAVKRSGLQAFRDFTVVYVLIGEEYEVRMLELGRQDDEWVEILGGLQAGVRYVSENSYVVKADIEKAGASHDH